MSLEEHLEPGAQDLIPCAGPVKEGVAFRVIGQSQGLKEEEFFLLATFRVIGRFHARDKQSTIPECPEKGPVICVRRLR
jgi:hypothetical protein